MDVALFSYGTLQQTEVQLATYGRELGGAPDVLSGYRLVPLTITDPRVIALSGKAVHAIARATGNPADLVPGVVFELTDAELAASDRYEVDVYARVEVALESGRSAWVYVGPPFEI
jgi:Gamma-glutamyl cyclotransferase, AIG2-like